MYIASLIDNLPLRLLRGCESTILSGIVEDSRLARPGCLFIARRGRKHDGRAFIGDAVAAGAAAVLCDDAAAAVPRDVTALYADDVPLAAALIAERFCANPSKRLTMIGVTGTNGKTTTAHLVHQMLNHRSAGRCGLIGTVQVDDGAAIEPARFTTPPAIEMSSLLKRMVDHGCGACAMEVSSHALAQKRSAGIEFNIGIFTNLSGDHLDYHGSMGAYLAAKLVLFEALPAEGVAIVNVDDAVVGEVLAACRCRILRCSMDDRPADCHAHIIGGTLTLSRAVFRGPWGELDVRLPLCGRHNVMNALQAAAACHAVGMDAEDLCAALEGCAAPPGRLEPVLPPGGDAVAAPLVLVDYAHTDDALENVLLAIRPLVPQGAALRVVFGCGGNRDRTKRPRMAAAAWRYADEVVLTSDNPRIEEPGGIVEEIFAGVPEGFRDRTLRIVDRRKAIHAAINGSAAGDVVLIAGKGHEDYQIIGEERRPFDDRKVAHEALKGRCPSGTSAANRQIAPEDSPHGTSDFFCMAAVAHVTGGRWIQAPKASDGVLAGVGIDTRQDLAGRAFFAIRGERFDGHEFLHEAARAGRAQMLVVDRDVPADRMPGDIGVCRVDDARAALGRLASAWRDRLGGPVIAITGSAGKTTTKRLLDGILSQTMRGSAAPRSYNNDIGVPLTLLSARPDDEYVIVEVGTNAPGEIDALGAIVRPDIAVITMIGRAHLEGLGSVDAVAEEKASLLRHVRGGGAVVLNGASSELRVHVDGLRGPGPAVASTRRAATATITTCMTFGGSDEADLRLTGRGITEDGRAWLEVNGVDHFFLAMPGEHNAMNALAAIAVARHLGVRNDAVRAGLASVGPEAMRFTRETVAGIEICNDAYNANPESMAAALEAFAELAADAPRRVLVLGEMLELGSAAPDLHRWLGRQIAAMPSACPGDRIVLIGELMHHAAAVLRQSGPDERVTHLSEANEAAMAQAASLLRPGDAVLLKGSRRLAVERVVGQLLQRAGETLRHKGAEARREGQVNRSTSQQSTLPHSVALRGPPW